jgi:hypothetical protein
MYNERIKKEYISKKEATTSIPEGFLIRQFNNAEQFENELGKDLCCFTVYDIVNMYKTLNYTSLESLRVINSHFSLYTQWCLFNNLVPDCQNHFTEVKDDRLLKCVNVAIIKKSIITKETVYKWVDELPNPSDAFILLALFEGIKGQEFCEIANLKMSDFKGNTVTLCTGRKLTVSDKLLSLAMKSDEEIYYHSITGHQTKTVKFLEEDLIVKNYPNATRTSSFQKGRRIYHKVVRALEYVGAEWMRMNQIFESGKINAINERAKELNTTVEDLIYRHYDIEDISERYEFNFARSRAVFMKKYREYLV